MPRRTQQQGAGVAQIVEADVRQFGPREQYLEGADSVARLRWRLGAVGKYQIPIAPPLPTPRAQRPAARGALRLTGSAPPIWGGFGGYAASSAGPGPACPRCAPWSGR